ncbi:hypothetical protein [Streptomyces sp. SA15]|uniref:hypothetical protein n=1 Tax=Streptomyces sp. SA15 TaxID=934019 RepID=UPI00117E36F6|nr:hypothetical protein [Streptomyces sp. SA15]
MTDEQHSENAASVRVGGPDESLEQRLDDELTAFNARATGAGTPGDFTVRVEDTDGELLGGLTACSSTR